MTLFCCSGQPWGADLVQNSFGALRPSTLILMCSTASARSGAPADLEKRLQRAEDKFDTQLARHKVQLQQALLGLSDTETASHYRMGVTLFTPDVIPSDQPCWLPWMSKSFFFFFLCALPAFVCYQGQYTGWLVQAPDRLSSAHK